MHSIWVGMRCVLIKTPKNGWSLIYLSSTGVRDWCTYVGFQLNCLRDISRNAMACARPPGTTLKITFGFNLTRQIEAAIVIL
jgi:hypothetical protein